MERDEVTERAQSDPTTAGAAREQWTTMLGALSNTVALRGLIGVVAGLVVLLFPTATTSLVTVIVIALLAFSGGLDLFYAATGRRSSGSPAGSSTGGGGERSSRRCWCSPEPESP